MNKFLLTMLAVGTMMTAAAQIPSTAPATGTLDLDYTASDGSMPNVSGLSSVKLIVEAKINRDCPGEVILKKDGNLLMAIPASNERRITIEETGIEVLRPAAEVATRAEEKTGNIWFTFYTNIKESQCASAGKYQIVVPSGLYTTEDGVTNKAFVLNYTLVGGQADGLHVVFNPANASTVETLSTINVTYDGASAVTLKDKSKIYLPDPFAQPSEEEGAAPADLDFNVTVSGNVVRLTLADPLAEKCNATLIMEEGAFAVTIGGTTSDSPYSYVSYSVTGKQGGEDTEYSITPAPGTYTQIDGVKADYQNGGDIYSWFRIPLPEGATLKRTNMMQYIYLRNAAGENVTAKGGLAIKTPSGQTEVAISGASYEAAFNGFPFRNGAPLKLTPGSYYLYIPAGAFTYTLDGVDISNPELTFGPYDMEMVPPTYTVTPADGTELEAIKQIVVKFDEGSKMSWNVTEWATLSNEQSKVIYDVRPVMTENENGIPVVSNEIVFDFPSEIVIPGDYVFTIGSGALKVDDTPMIINLHYTVHPNYIKQLTLSHGSELVDAEFIPANDEDPEHWTASVSIPAGGKMEITFELPLGYDELYYFDNSGMSQEVNLPASELTDPSVGFKLAKDNTIPVKAGENRITFTYGANGECLTPTLLVLTVDTETTGVEAIEAEGVAEYYNLQGVKVANPEKGIFVKVVNGKALKVVK